MTSVFLIVSLTATCQEQSKDLLKKIKEKQDIANKLVDCDLLSMSYKTLVIDTMKLHKEVDRKEGVILRLLDQRDSYRRLNDSTQLLIAAKDEEITNQEKIIKRAGKVKRFGIGPYAGYGLSGLSSLGVSVGISVQYSFIRF